MFIKIILEVMMWWKKLNGNNLFLFVLYVFLYEVSEFFFVEVFLECDWYFGGELDGDFDVDWIFLDIWDFCCEDFWVVDFFVGFLLLKLFL